MTRAHFDPHARPACRTTRRAFTLVELMISIALVLLLMLGINQVFKVTGEAVGTNQAISTGLRDARAVQAVFNGDLAAWATDVPLASSPPVIIRSERVSAFRNKADQQQDRDWTIPLPTGIDPRLTIDIDGNGTEGETTVAGERISPAIYNFRSHRVDRMMFFGRGLFRRQTGGALPAAGVYADEYVADMSSAEAWIWYGHLKRPDERAQPLTNNEQYPHRNPGELPNPNVSPPVFNDRNFHASDFVLGRMAMLCASGTDTSTPADGVDDEILDRRGIPQRFIARTTGLIPPPATPTLSPLIENVQSNEQNASKRWAIQWSRYDLVNTTISQFKGILTNWLEVNGTITPSTSAMAWYNQMGDWRFQGDPQPLRPFTTDNAARVTPVLLEHCSQFIVEFAGDFLNQNVTTGALDPTNPYQPDGRIDFLIDTSTGTPTRRIRWYGMPRDVAGSATGGPDGVIRGGAGVADPNQLVDVVPLRDVLGGTFTYTPSMVGGVTTEFIERRLPWPSPSAPPSNYTVSMDADDKYVVAWGPDTVDQPRPKMIRIVVTIDDPDGRIADGQTFEYVFRVGG